MDCNGMCAICYTPCFRGEIRGNQEKFSPISPEEELGAAKAFDAPIDTKKSEETGLVVVENIGEYKIVKRLGREKVRKVK